MRAHIVLAHPEAGSFNSHLSGTSKSVLGETGWQTTLSDLYAMRFDPSQGPDHYSARKDPKFFIPKPNSVTTQTIQLCQKT